MIDLLISKYYEKKLQLQKKTLTHFNLLIQNYNNTHLISSIHTHPYTNSYTNDTTNPHTSTTRYIDTN